jgi:glycosyltransferase involved in cell wall biosynthesis
MSGSIPVVSVIIPTHNRRASVSRTLAALGAQSMRPDRFEVIVVADGCSDDTAQALSALHHPFAFRLIEQHGQGQGKARNVGADAATGSILVFLDDDIEPLPGMLEAYEESHRHHPGHLLLGPALPMLPEDRSLFAQGLRNWWNDHIRSLTHPAHRFSYRDMHSGNFSMSGELFRQMQGFDPEFFGRSGEDYEFGIRLLAQGVSFAVAGDAAGYHHDATDLKRSLVRVRMEGRADVLIGLRHPELRAGTTLASFRAPPSQLTKRLRDLAFRFPALGDFVARLLLALLGPLERLRGRRVWRRVHGAVRSYWYCRGAAEELRTSASGIGLNEFLDRAVHREEPVATIDLGQGLEQSMGEVDRLRPMGVMLQLAGNFVGAIKPVAGAEPLRGKHLPPYLAGEAHYHLLKAMSAQRVKSGSPWLPR